MANAGPIAWPMGCTIAVPASAAVASLAAEDRDSRSGGTVPLSEGTAWSSLPSRDVAAAPEQAVRLVLPKPAARAMDDKASSALRSFAEDSVAQDAGRRESSS